MRERRITTVRDARATQDRIVLTLEGCGHRLSVSMATLQSLMHTDALSLLDGTASVMCHFCEDVPAGKTPIQLWKEAGQP